MHIYDIELKASTEQRQRWAYTKNKDDCDLCDLKFLSETMLQMY